MGELVARESAKPSSPITVDTFAGRVRVEWDPAAAMTPMGAAVVLHRFSQDRRDIRSVGVRLSAAL